VFYHFGKVTDIQVHFQENFAIVTYEKLVDAYMALYCLNDFYLEEQKVTLQIRWVTSEECKAPLIQHLASPQQQQYFPQNSAAPSDFKPTPSPLQQSQNFSMIQNSQPVFSPNSNKNTPNDENVKFTCRFDVQIDNENQF